jgi:hypothetical protein
MKNYLEFAKNIFSQNGEDGILEEIFKDLNITSGLLIEFGAWDGIYLSNTFNLLKNNKEFNGFLIESHPDRFIDLQKIQNKEGNRISILNANVNYDDYSDNLIDNLIEKSNLQNIPIRLISIDIDSYDYFIVKSIKKYLPDIFVVEVNTTFKKHEKYFGLDCCSLFSLHDLMIEKGYSLVCFVGNAIYIKKELTNINYNPEDIYLEYNDYVECAKINNLGEKIDEIYFLSNNYIDFINNTKNEYKSYEDFNASK